VPLVHADPDEMAALAQRIESVQAQCHEDLEGMLDGLNGPLADAWQDTRYNTFSMELAAQLALLRDELNALSLLADAINRRRQPLLAYLGQDSIQAMGGHGPPDVSEHVGAAPLKPVGIDVVAASSRELTSKSVLNSQASTDNASKLTLAGKTHQDKTTAVLTAADVTNPEGPKKLPPSPKEVEQAVQWAKDKLDALPKEGHLSREREAELFAAGKINPVEHKEHQLQFDGMDAFVKSEAGKAAGLTSGSTTDEIIQAAHNHLRKLNESNYQRVQSGEAEHPSGVSAERLKLAVEGNADGERVPLTYKGKSGDVNDLTGATEQMREFQGGIADIADRNGITDMQVVQVGSGTTGWKNNPMKLLRHYGSGLSDEDWFHDGRWKPSSDTDLAVFSDQAKVGAMQVDNPINADYGIFKTGSPDGKRGFSNTDLGHDLYRYGKEWDQRAYDPATLAKPENKDGLFDFKLNIGNDAFTTPPTMYTGPDRT